MEGPRNHSHRFVKRVNRLWTYAAGERKQALCRMFAFLAGSSPMACLFFYHLDGGALSPVFVPTFSTLPVPVAPSVSHFFCLHDAVSRSLRGCLDSYIVYWMRCVVWWTRARDCVSACSMVDRLSLEGLAARWAVLVAGGDSLRRHSCGARLGLASRA